MEWIKIKVKHYAYTDLTILQIGALVKYQLLIAMLERVPTKKEIVKCIGRYAARNLHKFATKASTNCHTIVTKVLEDCHKYEKQKEKNKQKMADYRQKHSFVASNKTSNEPGKIREDKIREDNIIRRTQPANAGTPQAELIESWKALYQAKTGQPYNANSKDYVLAAKLLKKFSADQVIEKAKLLFEFCQRGDVWFAKSMADFTIGKLSSMWNQIIKEAQNGAGISERELTSFMSGRE